MSQSIISGPLVTRASRSLRRRLRPPAQPLTSPRDLGEGVQRSPPREEAPRRRRSDSPRARSGADAAEPPLSRVSSSTSAWWCCRRASWQGCQAEASPSTRAACTEAVVELIAASMTTRVKVAGPGGAEHRASRRCRPRSVGECSRSSVEARHCGAQSGAGDGQAAGRPNRVIDALGAHQTPGALPWKKRSVPA